MDWLEILGYAVLAGWNVLALGISTATPEFFYIVLAPITVIYLMSMANRVRASAREASTTFRELALERTRGRISRGMRGVPFVVIFFAGYAGFSWLYAPTRENATLTVIYLIVLGVFGFGPLIFGRERGVATGPR